MSNPKVTESLKKLPSLSIFLLFGMILSRMDGKKNAFPSEHLPAKGRGSDTEVAPYVVGEVALVGEADRARDVADGEVGS